MFFIERLSNQFAARISIILGLDKDHEEVLAYGAFTVFHTLWSIFLVAVFGMIFNVTLEALVMSFAASILRKYSGGVHATSPNRCAALGAFTFVGLSLIVQKIMSMSIGYLFIYSIICFLFAYYILFRYCPVDTPNKPIIKPEKKARLRKRSFQILHVYLLVTMLFFAMMYIQGIKETLLKVLLAVGMGAAWQAFTLTKQGHLMISSFDIGLKKLMKGIGGEGR